MAEMTVERVMGRRMETVIIAEGMFMETAAENVMSMEGMFMETVTKAVMNTVFETGKWGFTVCAMYWR